MRGKVARSIRQMVYGPGESCRYRKYREIRRDGCWPQVVSDSSRQYYQRLKAEHKENRRAQC